MATEPILSEEGGFAMLDALGELNDGGAIDIYEGGALEAVPVDCEAANTGELLAELALSGTEVWTAAAGEPPEIEMAEAEITADSSADETGEANYFRITDSLGEAIFQGTAATASADLVLNTEEISLGANVSIESANITLPLGN